MFDIANDIADEIADANHYAAEHARAWRDECRERAARIRNVMQALMLAAEEAAMELHRCGDLKLTADKFVQDHWKSVPITPQQAAAFVASGVHETLLDALSLTALEALDVAGEAP